MNRREFLGTAGAAAWWVATESFAAAPRTPSVGGLADKPNIIFILADDLGYADLGCYGQKKIRTPNFDRLAAEGTRFTNAYAGSTVCAPSRCVLMTGLHTGHARVRANFSEVKRPDAPGRRVPLRAEDVTVAEVLKQNGYATGITGKWGLGEPETPGIPNRHGFDEWLGFLNQDHALEYYTSYLWRNEEKMAVEANQDGKKGKFVQDLFMDFALDFIRRRRGQPFFLYWEFSRKGLQQAVRWGNWKAYRKDIGAPLQLFDLAADPAEEHNVAEEHPDVVARIAEHLKSARVDSLYWPLEKPPKEKKSKK